MESNVYRDVLKSIRQFKGLTKDCDRMLRAAYPQIPAETLGSILSSEIRQRMKVNHARLCSHRKEYYQKYMNAMRCGEPTGVLVRMSVKTGLLPALLARIILENYCEDKKIKLCRAEVTQLLKDTTLIEDKDLAYEIYLCIIQDDQYGSISMAAKHSLGLEYEVKLQRCIRERNIPFHDEDHLRLRGYDKTPDIKLEVPIAVNGFVINWIESKALFGDSEVHKQYTEEQFLSYWNRFGPGLVIYWFGYLDILNQDNERKFIIMDHFPEVITYMNPKSVKSSIL